MKKKLLILVTILMVFCLSACGDKEVEQQEEHDHEHDVKVVANLRIGLEAHEGEAQYEAAVRFAKEVEAKSEGAIKATVYGAGKLGTEEELLKYIADDENRVDIVVASALSLSEYEPNLQLPELAFAMSDYEDVRNFYNSEAQKNTTTALGEHNMRVLAQYMGSFHVLAMKDKKISAPTDLQEVRLASVGNSMSKIAMKMMGAQIMPYDDSEIREMVQKGRCDGVEGSLEEIYENQLYMKQQYLVVTNHSFSSSVLVISEKTWDGLDAEYQEILSEAAVSSSHANIEMVQQNDNKMISEMESAGVRVQMPNLKLFWQKAEPSVKNYGSQSGMRVDQLVMWKENR